MKKLLLTTSDSFAPLILRVFLALVIFPHGAQKLLGWFNGYGFEGTMKYFTDTVGLAWPIGFLVIMIEFFGTIAILVGFATRLWSLGMLVVMAGIILTNFSSHFFMNWFGNQPSEGMEFFLLAIGISAALIYSGSGRYSIDGLLMKKSLLRINGRELKAQTQTDKHALKTKIA